MERETALAEKLRVVSFDMDQITDAQRVEVATLARRARVELWHPGLRWPSSDHAARDGGDLTPCGVAP
jgi:hypothetical protein